MGLRTYYFYILVAMAAQQIEAYVNSTFL